MISPGSLQIKFLLKKKLCYRTEKVCNTGKFNRFSSVRTKWLSSLKGLSIISPSIPNLENDYLVRGTEYMWECKSLLGIIFIPLETWSNPSGSHSVLLSGDVLVGEGLEVGCSRIWSSRRCVELVYVQVLIRRFKGLTALWALRINSLRRLSVTRAWNYFSCKRALFNPEKINSNSMHRFGLV